MDYDIRNPRRVRTDMIDVMWNHPDFGLIPYTCVNSTGEEQMQDIWDRITRGEFGTVQEAK